MKRRLLTAALIICLAAIIASGTLAYFTDTGRLSNEFMTATYDPENPDQVVDPDSLFSIRVYETDKDGKQTTTGLTYKNIAPGQVIDKDPTVQNTGKYGQWVRVAVTVTEAKAWTDAGILDLTQHIDYDKTQWTCVAPLAINSDDSVTYVFYLNKVLESGQTATLFNHVTIPPTLRVEDMTKLSHFEINIAADAIQSDNTGANAQIAFDNYWE